MDLYLGHLCGQLGLGHTPIFWALFLAGLGGSVTHCLTMCSVFVLGQTPGSETWLGRLLLPYHLGRLTTYAFLGALAAAGIGLLPHSGAVDVLRHGILALAAALFMAILAERLLARIGVRLPIRLPAVKVCGLKGLTGLKSTTDGWRRFGLGISMGFLPCPLVLAATMAASTTGDPARAALAMALFGLGTMPSLLAVALGKSHFLKFSPRVQDGLTIAALGINSVILVALVVT